MKDALPSLAVVLASFLCLSSNLQSADFSSYLQWTVCVLLCKCTWSDNTRVPPEMIDLPSSSLLLETTYLTTEELKLTYQEGQRDSHDIVSVSDRYIHLSSCHSRLTDTHEYIIALKGCRPVRCQTFKNRHNNTTVTLYSSSSGEA